MTNHSSPSRKRKTITRHYGETLMVSLIIMVLLSVMLILKDRRVYKTHAVNTESSILANSTVAYYSYLVSVMLRSDSPALEKYLHQIRVEEQLDAVEFVKPGASADILLNKCHADNTAKKIAGYIPSCHFLEGDRVRVLQEFTSGSRTLGYLVKTHKLLLTPSARYFVQRPLLLLWLICMVIFGVYYWRQLHTHLVKPLALIVRKTEKLTVYEGIDYKLHEIHHLSDTLAAAHAALVEQSRLAAIEEIAGQVAHDIRSPLTALKVVAHHLAELPEDQRVMIRNAVQRIEDIANHLAEKKTSAPAPADGTQPAHEAMSVQLLSSLIEPLISEKRSQFRQRLGVQIHATLDAVSYGLFAQVQPVEFKRVLSNLVNNAVEALPEGGAVTVAFTQAAQGAQITVSDTGTGIPPDRLPRLMQRGATFDKAGGSGLGLYHARTTIEQWGGTLTLTSVIGQGTTVAITLPRAAPPPWFVPELCLGAGTTIVVIDDDTSIHDVWDKRLGTLPLAQHGIRVEHFSSGTAVCQWVAQQPTTPLLFLCDYELLGEPSNGLELIERLQIHEQAILVTSRYEEPDVQARCAKLGVQLLPKGLAGSVPIRWIEDVQPAVGDGTPVMVAPPEATSVDSENNTSTDDVVTPFPATKPNVLVLDDDDGIRLAWRLERERLGIGELTAYPSMEACEQAQCDYPAYEFAFVDKHIPNSVWRIDQVIAHLKSVGVKKVIVATGEQAAEVARDPLCAAADGIAPAKIPDALPRFGGPDNA